MTTSVLYHPTVSCRSCGSHIVEVRGEWRGASPAQCRQCGTSHGTWITLMERAEIRRKADQFIGPFHAKLAEAVR